MQLLHFSSPFGWSWYFIAALGAFIAAGHLAAPIRRTPKLDGVRPATQLAAAERQLQGLLEF
jgi:hypothetical protein